MPDCYHVVNPGQPNDIARDIMDCVREVGGGGHVRKLKKRRGQNIVHAWTRYGDAATAREHLDRITGCLRSKGHWVSEYAVVGPDHELDLEEADFDFVVEGYEPDDPGTTAA